MGEAGEAIWAKIVGGVVLGRGTLGGWHGSPPVDVVDYKHRIGYQIKVVTDPHKTVSFSGAHKRVRGQRIRGRPRYVGTPEDKLEDIRAWLKKMNLTGVLVVLVLDEDANRATVHVQPGVHNIGIRDMEPIGVIDNDHHEFIVPPLIRDGIAATGLPIPDHMAGLPAMPHIPAFLRSSTSGEVIPEIAHVAPLPLKQVRVRSHRRKR
jgi:hypothetical protein